MDRAGSRKGAIAAIAGLAALQLLWIVPGARLGADFSQFWAVARIPVSEFSDPARLVAAQRSILKGTEAPTVPAYLRPPVFALAFRPLRYVSLVVGYRIWVAAQFSALATLLWLLWRESGVSPFFIVLVGLSPPVMYGITVGQDAPTVTLLALLGFIAMDRGRDWLAGLLFALCLYKFNLFLFVPVFLLIHRRYRVLAWFAGAGLVLALASMAMMPPGAYLHFLTHIKEYDPEYQPALHGFGFQRLAIAAGVPWAWWIVGPTGLIASWILAAWLKPAMGFSLMIAAILATAYYQYFYDYTLSLIPIFFVMRDGSRVTKALAVVALAVPMIWLSGVWASVWGVLFPIALALERPSRLRSDAAPSFEGGVKKNPKFSCEK